ALRRSALYQATLFGGFSAAWSALALLLTGPRYHLGAQAVGALALIGAASMLCAPAAGGRVDRHGPDRVNRWCATATLACAALLTAGTAGGPLGLAALAAGLLLLDVALQCGQIANQARILALRPEARSRLNTAYMTCAFLGGSAGSWLGVRAYDRWGWPGVCALLALAAAAALTTGAAAPRTTEARAATPRTTEAAVTEPGVTEPGVTERGVTERGVTEARTTQPVGTERNPS
ncbi:MFS transporter, partial [Streptomyces sp. FH025]|uniref:MFS transporter n=1 Tax=Streptomyces sp. FH025 TaxID=2815937 RepID=UPI001A9FFF30